MPAPVLVSHRPTPDTFRKLTRRVGSVLGGLALLYLIVLLIAVAVNPNGPNPQKQIDGELWAATSHSWLDRVTCQWLGICGGSNWLASTWAFRRASSPQPIRGDHNHQDEWTDPTAKPQEWSEDEIESRTIPEYVFKHAPLLYLAKNEEWWPSDVADFLHHIQYREDGRSEAEEVRLSTMAKLLARDHTRGGKYLQSLEDAEELPDWIMSTQNRPTRKYDHRNEATKPSAALEYSPRSRLRSQQHRNTIHRPAQDGTMMEQKVLMSTTTSAMAGSGPISADNTRSPGARSSAPAFLITVDKGNSTVDAFWFFFYAFNRGARVTGIQYGNHVGDWEHVLVRFHAAEPIGLFLSAHEWGSAYEFAAMEKLDVNPDRPVVYAGMGSHANYATPGKHAYALPLALLGDTCSRGYLWDPVLNLKSFVHNPNAEGWPVAPKFKASVHNPHAHTSWLEYKGRWGDKRLSLSDEKGRNYRFAGEYKYLSGPTGPWDKALNRSVLCEHENKPCELRESRGGYVGPMKGTVDVESIYS